MAVTIRDIARKCGVGVSTVSRALNNHPDINPQTREKIMKVVEETGFVPNDSARYLKRTENNSIALLVKGITNPFFLGIIRGIEEFSLQKDYTTILRAVENGEDEVRVAQALVQEKKLKGIIFLGGAFTHEEKSLRQIGVPFVFSTISCTPQVVGKSEKKNLLYANVAVNDLEESRKEVQYLIDLGHKKIGIVTEGEDELSVGNLRLHGYQMALEENGLPFRADYVYNIREGADHYAIPNGYTAAKALIERHPDITALFCISDTLAVGACRAILDLGKKIPEDMSIAGYDGIELGSYYSPRLTTIEQPREEIAQKTIQLLFDMIEKKADPQNIIIPARLLERESTAAIS